MTDKPRLDADKIREWVEKENTELPRRSFSDTYAAGKFATLNELLTKIESGDFKTDPPQQPDIQMRDERDLAADLKILEAFSRDSNESIDMVHDVVAPHALRRAIAAESLIQQKDAQINRLHMECEGMELKYISDMEQKDAEIAELKRLAEFWESQYSDATTHGDETEERLNAKIAKLRSAIEKALAEYELHEEPGAVAECMWQILYTHGQPEHASLLQDKGDKL